MDEKPTKNLDPITGEPGAHLVGSGVGAVSGGVAGAALGAAIGGPIGAAGGDSCRRHRCGVWAKLSHNIGPRDPDRGIRGGF